MIDNPKQPNFILLTMDAVRKDVFERMLESGDLECLSGLKCDFVRFKNFFANGPNTYHSMPSIFASKYSSVNGIGICDFERTIPFYFKQAGYTTVGINQGNPWCGKGCGFDKDFDLFVDFIDISHLGVDNCSTGTNVLSNKYKSICSHLPVGFKKVFAKIIFNMTTIINNPRRSPELYERLLRLQRRFYRSVDETVSCLNNLQPFFMWLHFMDSHSPYIAGYHNNSSEYIRCNSGLIRSRRFIQKGFDLYRKSLRQIDQSIGRLVKMLKEQGIYDKTNIIITSDHGEEFYEHGEFGHSHYQCFDEVLKIPLLIKADNVTHLSAYDETLCSQIDLMPTILAISGINTAAQYPMLGSNILSDGCTKHRPILSTSFQGNRENDETAICKVLRKEQYKLKVCESRNIYELYDLSSDPDERNNIFVRKKDIACNLISESAMELQRARNVNSMQKLIHHAGKV